MDISVRLLFPVIRPYPSTGAAHRANAECETIAPPPVRRLTNLNIFRLLFKKPLVMSRLLREPQQLLKADIPMAGGHKGWSVFRPAITRSANGGSIFKSHYYAHSVHFFVKQMNALNQSKRSEYTSAVFKLPSVT
jgi:hypothetical protein